MQRFRWVKLSKSNISIAVFTVLFFYFVCRTLANSYFVKPGQIPHTRHILLPAGKDVKWPRNTPELVRPIAETCRLSVMGYNRFYYCGVATESVLAEAGLEWQTLKRLLDRDQELNLIDLGPSDGFMTLSTAVYGRHALALVPDEKVTRHVQESVNANTLNNVVQVFHTSVSKPQVLENELTNILKGSMIHMAVLRVADYSLSSKLVLETLMRHIDIPFVIASDRKSCPLLREFMKTWKYDAYDEQLIKPLPNEEHEPCRSTVVWMATNLNKNYVIYGHRLNDKINVIDPNLVPSMLNYLQCSPLKTADENFVCYSTKDKFIGPHIEAAGGWENYVWDPIKRFLQKDPEIGFIDIGANIGVFSINAAAMKRPVLAVEAFFENVQRLCEAVRINKMNGITIVHNAVTDIHEIVHFRSPPGNPGGTSVLSENTYHHPSVVYKGKYSTVQSITLSDLVQLAPKKAVMKIDIEGAEIKAFRTFEELLIHIDITAVVMEWTGIKRSSDCMEIVTMMLRHGYKPHGLHWREWWISGYMPTLASDSWESVRSWPGDIAWTK